jgi:hypothetical protein
LARKWLVELIKLSGGLDLLWCELPFAAQLTEGIARCQPHQEEEQDGDEHQRDGGLQAPTEQPASHLKVHSLTSSQDDSGRMGALLKRRLTAYAKAGAYTKTAGWLASMRRNISCHTLAVPVLMVIARSSNESTPGSQ